MLDPTRNMSSGRIMMRPMYNATLYVPLVFTKNLYCVTLAKTIHARREVDVVTDQYSLSGTEHEYESLVS